MLSPFPMLEPNLAFLRNVPFSVPNSLCYLCKSCISLSLSLLEYQPFHKKGP